MRHTTTCPQVLSAGSLPPELYSLVAAFNAELLGLERDGRTLLVARLVELIRVRQGVMI